MTLEQFQAGQQLAPKISQAIPDGTERGVVHAALAVMLASQFSGDALTEDEIEKYMDQFAKFVCAVVAVHRAFEKELN